MTTKEKIIEEALTLFSTKGYKGTSVKNVADAVGIKGSSLYKHFKSKKEIFDTIVKEMQNRMSGLSPVAGPASGDCKAEANAYGKLNIDGLRTLSRQIFLFYLKDDFVSRFWRMAMMEQYHSPEIYKIYHRIFMEESITYQANLFREMTRQGYFISIDPEIMAVSFYSPIFFLLTKYMGEPEKEETALILLDKQVEEFCRIYWNPNR
ncbi:TetR/AcrR family transcriptional regulator [Caproiciproducens sp. R2]|uniref:TetR/AcrR family transcriptional regulator n=1 Tax=Caproiciproducens sp. R2 TaxID=3435187 RepID=UPI0040337FC7